MSQLPDAMEFEEFYKSCSDGNSTLNGLNVRLMQVNGIAIL